MSFIFKTVIEIKELSMYLDSFSYELYFRVTKMLKLMGEHASSISIPGNKCGRNKIIRKYTIF